MGKITRMPAGDVVPLYGGDGGIVFVGGISTKCKEILTTANFFKILILKEKKRQNITDVKIEGIIKRQITP